MKKKILFLSIVFLLYLTLSYTYSSFKNTIVGNISGNIKDWVFKVSIDNSTKYEDGYKLHLTGTSGSFNIDINTTGGTKGAGYSIELIGDSSIKYYTDSSYTNLISNNIYNGSVNSNTSDTITIYYKSDNNIDSDILIKTKAIIKEISYAMMKNGTDASGNSGTEFWHYKYKAYIRSLNFESSINNLPSSCTENNLCWDVSYDASQENKVYAYLTDSGYKDSTDTSKVLYNLYIVSNSIIQAPQDCTKMFADFYNLASISFDNFSTFNTTNMSFMFRHLHTLKNINLDNIDTSTVTNMEGMFWGCEAFTTLDLSKLDTSHATTLNSMFAQCTGLVTLDLSTFNTSKVTNMNSMFYFCQNLTNLNLSGFDTSKVVKMNSMFYSCQKLQTELEIKNADMTDYTNMFLSSLNDTNAHVILKYISSTYGIVTNMKATCNTYPSKIELQQISTSIN